MTMYWVYNIPHWLFGIGTVGAFIALSVLGLVLTRRPVAYLVGPAPGANETVSYYFAVFGVFYGLTVGLIAVATLESYSNTNRAVGAEAAVVAALYRDVSSYPESYRRELQSLLREYTRYVIDDAWPQQQRGEVPIGGTKQITDFQDHLYGFEPKTPGQQAIHSETLQSFNRMIELRRARLQAVTTGLPAALWWVVLVGSALTISSSFLFHCQRFRVHLVLTVLLASLMGLLIFLVAAMDNPFRGEVSIGSEAFKLVYQGLMGG